MSSPVPVRSRPSGRPTAWWLETLRRRAERMSYERLELSERIVWKSLEEQRAAVKFFNAAFRAEESGLTQAAELADQVSAWDPDLGEVLRLYGAEEGWHRELISAFLAHIDGNVLPMGKVTRTFYRLYGRARRMETIVLTNLMFETIGATTYRLALRNVQQVSARQMLTILTRDESFHVPLNVHFLRQVMARQPRSARLRLKVLFQLLFLGLVALPIASRPKARAFDGIGLPTLCRAYAEQLAKLFLAEPDLGLRPPWLLLVLLGLSPRALAAQGGASSASAETTELAADRDQVEVTPL
jgi:hypothetical protein